MENLVVNNKDNGVFMSRNYRSDSCPLDIGVRAGGGGGGLHAAPQFQNFFLHFTGKTLIIRAKVLGKEHSKR